MTTPDVPEMHDDPSWLGDGIDAVIEAILSDEEGS